MIPWRKAWQPTLVFLPGESHGQRNLKGRSPQGHAESDMTEAVLAHTHARKNYSEDKTKMLSAWIFTKAYLLFGEDFLSQKC